MHLVNMNLMFHVLFLSVIEYFWYSLKKLLSIYGSNYNCFARSHTTMVFWVFGYGSLVWNPGFEYDEKVIGFIKDYRRVFDVGKFLISILYS